MTSIEWTDATWNPVTGCTKVSAGCKNCYAERVFPRVRHIGGGRDGGAMQFGKPSESMRHGGPRQFTDVWCHEDRLAEPLHWRKPRRVFVNSMSDLFHEDVPDLFLDRVFATMALAPKHTFQVLTKRPKRMLRWFAGGSRRNSSSGAWWPLPNVWLGVSCEDQKSADERIPLLLQTPAAVRFLSCEPLLGPIDFKSTPQPDCDRRSIINWVIVGGESGPGARLCDVAWIRSIVEQCKSATVPVFVKQLGANYCDAENGIGGHRAQPDPQLVPQIQRLRDRKGGNPAEWPEDLRVRRFPEARP